MSRKITPHMLKSEAMMQAHQSSVDKLARNLMRTEEITDWDIAQHRAEMLIQKGHIPNIDNEKLQDFKKFTDKKVFHAPKGFKNIDNPLTTSERIQEYNKINQNFYQKIANFTNQNVHKKMQSGEDLQIQNISMNQEWNFQRINKKNATQSIQEVKGAIEKFIGAEQFGVFDIETLGGKDEAGIQRLDSVTEFAMQIMDKKGNIKDTFEIGIGIDEKKAEELFGIIKDIEERGYVTDRHRVVGERLAMAGDTRATFNIGEQIVRPVSRDKAKLHDINAMRRAVKNYLSLGKKQEQIRKQTGLYPWERKISDAITSATEGGGVGVSYHGAGFDIPMLERFSAERGSPEGQRLFKSQLGILKENHLDVLQAQRYLPHDKNTELLSPDVARQMREQGIRYNTQEGLMMRLEVDRGVAHVATEDTRALGQGIVKDLQGRGSYLDFLSKNITDPNAMEINIRTGRQNLFMATDSVGPQNMDSTIMSFVKDSFSGELRSPAGMAFSERGAEKELFQPWLLKKDMPYTLKAAGKIEAKGEIAKSLKKLNPQANPEDLFYMELEPVYDDALLQSAKHAEKMKSPVTLIGNQREVEQLFQKSMLPTGEADAKSGAFKYLEGPQRKVIENMYSEVSVIRDGDGKISGSKVNGLPKLEELIREKTRNAIDDNASSVRRDSRMKQAEGYTKAVKYVEDLVQKGEYLTRDEAIRDLVKESSNIAKGITNRNINDKSMQASLQHFMKIRQDGRLARETADKFLGSYDDILNNIDVIDEVIFQSKELSKGDTKKEAYYFEQLMNQIQDRAGDKAFTGSVEVPASRLRTMKFDLDLGETFPELKKTGDGIVSFDLERSEYGIISSIERATGRKNLTEAQKSRYLREVYDQFFNESSRSIKGLKLHYPGEEIFENPDILAKQLQFDMQKVRDQEPSAGILKPFTAHRLDRAMSFEEMLGGKEEAIRTIQEMASNVGKSSVEIASKDTIGSIARNVANERFFAPSKEQLQAIGYMGDGLNTLSASMQTKKRGYQNLYETIFKGLHEAGFDIIQKNDQILIQSSEGILDISKHLPTQTFQDGISATKVGNSRVSNALTLAYDERTNKVRLSSHVEDSYQKTYFGQMSFIKREAEKGKGLEAAERYFKKLAENVREAPGLLRSDAKDARAMHQFDLSGFRESLPKIIKGGLINRAAIKPLGIEDIETEKMYRDALNRALDKLENTKEGKKANLSVSEESALRLYMPNLVDATESNLRREMGEGFNLKATGKGSSVIDNIYEMNPESVRSLGEGSTSQARGINFQELTAMGFDREEAKAYIESTGKDWRVDKAVETRIRQNYSNRAIEGTGGKRFSSVLTGKMVSTPDSNLRNIIAHHLKGVDQKSGFHKRLDLISTAESGSVINPEAVDKIFNQRTSLQKVKTDELLDLSTLSEAAMEGLQIGPGQELERRARLKPKISVNKETGEITSFAYSRGDRVSRHESILLKSRDGSPEAVRSAEDGFLRFGFFRRSDGQFMTEDMIKDYVNKSDMRETIRNTDDLIRFMKNQKHQGENVFTPQFYVDPFDLENQSKYVLNSVEKSMGRNLAVGLGQRDEKIKKALKGLDLEEFKGRLMSFENIEEMVDRQLETGKTIEGFRSKEELIKGIQEERYSDWRRFTEEVLGIDKDTIAVGDYLTEERNHGESAGDIQRISEAIRDYHHKSTDNIDEANNRVLRDFKRIYGQESELWGDTVVTPTDAKINLKEMSAILNEYGLDEEELYKRSIEGNEFYHFRGNISKIYDPSANKRMSYLEEFHSLTSDFVGGARIDDMGINTLSISKYDKTSLKALRETYGDELFNKHFGAIDPKRDQGKYVAEDLIRHMRSQMMQTPGEEYAIRDGIIQKGAIRSQRDLDILNDVQKQGIFKNVTVDKIEDYKVLESSAQAADFNQMKKIIDQEEMVDYLRNARVPTASSNILDVSTSRTPGDPGSAIFGSDNLILDLESDHLDESMLGRKYLQIPAYPTTLLSEDKYIANKVQEDVSEVQRQVRDYEDRMISGDFSPEQRNRAIERLRTKIDDTQRGITDLGFGKEGFAGKFRTSVMPGERAKLQLLNVNQHNLSQLEGMTYGGRALSDFYTGSSRQAINFSLTGEDFFRDILENNQIAEDFGITGTEDVRSFKKGLREKLKTEGVTGFDYRHPGIYPQSLSANKMYLSDELKKGEFLTSAAAAAAMKGDADGDTATFGLLRADTEIFDRDGRSIGKRKITELEKALYEERGFQVSFREENPFGAAHRNILHNAMTSEQYIDKLNTQEELMRGLKVSTDHRPINVDQLAAAGRTYGSLDSSGKLLLNETTKNEFYLSDALSKINQSYAGRVNYQIQALRGAHVSPEGPTGATGEMIYSVLTGMEERFLTSKKSGVDALQEINMLGELQDSLDTMFKKGEGSQKFIEWGEKFLLDRKEFTEGNAVRFGHLREIESGQPYAKEAIREAAKFFEQLGLGDPHVKNLLEMGNVSMKTYDPRISTYMDGDLSLRNIYNMTSLLKARTMEDISTIETIKKPASSALAGGITDSRMRLFQEEQMARSTTEKAMNMISDFGTNMSGKHIALGAVGIAGAVMGAAFVGGRTPAGQEQAREVHQEGMYEFDKLSDETQINHHPHQGYMINVNATTNKGQEEMQNIIHGAAQSSFGQNIHISMNTRTENGNIISERDIEKIIEGAFR